MALLILLLAIAFVVFVLAALGRLEASRLQLIAIGLACFTAAQLLPLLGLLHR